MALYEFSKAGAVSWKLHSEVARGLIEPLTITVSGSEIKIEFVDALSAGDQTILQQIVDDHDGGSGMIGISNHLVEQVTGGRIQSRRYYMNHDGVGGFTGLSKEELFSYSGSKLESIVENIYFTDGTLAKTDTYNFSTTDDGKLIQSKT